MTSRKKRLLIIQIILFILAILIFFKTYFYSDKNLSENILSEQTKIEISKKSNKDSNASNIFYDIVYSGLDLSGNRYIIKAKEASNTNNDDGYVNLKKVNAVFYFKDEKNLVITSNFGLYNNKTLDMKFKENVNAKYDSSTLTADTAEYFNSRNLIEISSNVKVNDYRGLIMAEKLIFDIKKKKLNITSSNSEKVKANLNYK